MVQTSGLNLYPPALDLCGYTRLGPRGRGKGFCLTVWVTCAGADGGTPSDEKAAEAWKMLGMTARRETAIPSVRCMLGWAGDWFWQITCATTQYARAKYRLVAGALTAAE